MKNGFTLIELLVVIAIVGIIAGSVVTVLNIPAQFAKARDAQRKSELSNLKTALEQYYNDNGRYPLSSNCPSGATTGWCGESTEFGGNADYVPGLAPKYMRVLPRDPNVNKANSANSSGTCTADRAGYLYLSDGKDYKLLAFCTPEQSPLSNKDAFWDPRPDNPRRGDYSWAVYSDGAALW